MMVMLFKTLVTMDNVKMLMENLKSEELLVNEEVMDLPDVDPHLHLSRQHSR